MLSAHILMNRMCETVCLQRLNAFWQYALSVVCVSWHVPVVTVPVDSFGADAVYLHW